MTSYALKLEKYYDLLGLRFPSTRDDIRKAYHKLCHIHHPDKGGDEKKFKEITKAYAFLIDNGYWDILAKREREAGPIQDTNWRPSIFVSDDGRSFWTEDVNGLVVKYWSVDTMRAYDGRAWRVDDESADFKDYVDHLENKKRVQIKSQKA